MRQLTALSLSICVLACASQTPGPRVDPGRDISELKSTLAKRDEKLAEWEKAPADAREACELGGFDCRIQVHEHRESFLRTRGISACRQPDPDIEARCVAAELIRQKDPKAAQDYYSTELWCLEQLIQCLQERSFKAKEKALLDLAEKRRLAIEDSERGHNAQARRSVALAKIQYLRATLPPAAENECQGFEPKKSCVSAADSLKKQLSEYYRKPESEYKEEQAKRLHDQATQAEATCHSPELDCLIARLPKYGDTKETQRLIDKNYAMLERRQRLVEKIGEAAAEYCLKQAVATNETQVVQSYVTYVRQPVLFFRMQLHRSFFTLHQSQVTCLTDFAKDQQ